MPSAHLRFVVVAASLAACAQPLPADRTAYAGEWSGPGTILSITLGGDLAFEQKTRGTTIEILGPIKEFDDDDIVVGFAFITSTIDVTSPPVARDGVWARAVSSVDLTKR
jgi:hypothetical protein